MVGQELRNLAPGHRADGAVLATHAAAGGDLLHVQGAVQADLLGAQARPVACPDDYDLSGTGVQDAFCAGYTGYNGFYGHGMVDALAAVSQRGHGPDTAEVTGPLS